MEVLRLPTEVTDVILSYLSETDLCRLAQCSRGSRERSNRDSLWRSLCLARGWDRFGTDLNLEGGFLDHSHDWIGESTETLECTCPWKAVFLKAVELETNWAEGRCHKISHPLIGKGSNKSQLGIASDGVYFVQGYHRGINIWEMKPQQQAGSNDYTLNFPWKGSWDISKMLVSKGVGLTLGCLDHWEQSFVRTFDCRTGKWLVGFLYRSSPVMNSYQLDGETMIGQPCTVGNLREFCVWSSIDGTLRHILKGHKRVIRMLVLRGNMAASAAENLKLWDVKQGVCLRNFKCPDKDYSFRKCKLSAKHVMSVCKYKNKEKLYIWNLESSADSDPLAMTVHFPTEYDHGGISPPWYDYQVYLNEFAVILCHLAGCAVWDQKGELIFSALGCGYLAETKLVRCPIWTNGEVWSLGPDSRHWRLLAKIPFLGMVSPFMTVYWTDDTKLVFNTSEDLQLKGCQPLDRVSPDQLAGEGQSFPSLWTLLYHKEDRRTKRIRVYWRRKVQVLQVW